MKRYFTEPLEITARTRRRWMDTGRECIVEINEDEDSLRNDLKTDIEICMREYCTAYMMIWFYDLGISQNYYKDRFNGFALVDSREDYLIYQLYLGDNMTMITDIWGECDILDIIFFDDEQVGKSYIDSILKESYSNYRKDFFKRISEAQAVISDSGDGNEYQLIASKSFLNEYKTRMTCMMTEDE